ncbi:MULTISPECIES: hypothetical protein [Burkholderiaceae]|uniref:hypothetical protein n=1 Tax=Burkholderiaceae TaxID=119060 RepID=UPI00142101D2|nr:MULTISPECIES: hypothetical protein [Burkholderiaceae]MBN3851229.1 hypothetical protein [Paraburkholderia sp. Ac-20342]NIF54051.1 hypothetical protein [Burkholderia sp. Ax-1724]NIF81617.1 hypothetical protein [Paraburkholderia sp. Cy-641]
MARFVTRVTTKASEKLRHAPARQEGELFFVTRLSEEGHQGHVIRNQFIPSRRQLNSGHLLIANANDKEKQRWYFYPNSDHPFAPESAQDQHARPGKLMVMDASGSTVAQENFTPSRSQLESGKYFLDHHEGVNNWYLIDDFASVFPDAVTDQPEQQG